jgi:predicted nuclease of predicted toxin-antitoxin system
VAIIETHRGVSDETVVALALAEDRVLLTEDKDFGQLVFAAARESSGVVFIRWPVSSRASLPVSLLEFLASSADRLQGIFAVVEPGRVRVTRLP